MKFIFNKDKNELLFKERRISFPEVIEVIAKHGILLNIDHPNKQKYPNQKMFVVNIDNYAYCVPYVLKNEVCFLKTIYPNRNFQYLIKGGKNDKI